MPDELKKHTLNLRAGDWDYLESVLSPNGISTSMFLRKQVSAIVDSWRSNQTPLPEITVPLKDI